MALTLARTTVIRFCNVCKKETQHQIRRCGQTAVSICVPCLERPLSVDPHGNALP
jgi:hypothetical protein